MELASDIYDRRVVNCSMLSDYTSWVWSYGHVHSFSSIRENVYSECYIYKWKAVSDCSYSKYIKVINTHMYCFPRCSPGPLYTMKVVRYSCMCLCTTVLHVTITAVYVHKYNMHPKICPSTQSSLFTALFADTIDCTNC